MEVVLGLQLVRPPDRHHRDVELVGDAGQRVARPDLVGPQEVAAVLDGRVDRDRLEERAVLEERAFDDGLVVEQGFGGRELGEDRRVARVGGVDGAGAVETGATADRDAGGGAIAGRATDRGGVPLAETLATEADEHDAGDGGSHDAVLADASDEASSNRPGRHRGASAVTNGGQMREAGHHVQTAPELDSHRVATGLEGRVGCRAFAARSAQASDDALDADRCVQQYGLLACGRSDALGREGWGRWTVQRSRIRAGVLSSRPNAR